MKVFVGWTEEEMRETARASSAEHSEAVLGWSIEKLRQVAAQRSGEHSNIWWHSAARDELARRGEPVPKPTGCALCGSNPEGACYYYYYPVSRTTAADYGTSRTTKTEWHSGDITKVIICDRCLDSYRSNCLALDWAIFLLSVCLVPVLVGILGVAVGAIKLWSVRASRRQELGDYLAGCWVEHDSTSALNQFRNPDFLTRTGWAAKAEEQV